MCLSLLVDLKGRKKIEPKDNIINSFTSKRLQKKAMLFTIFNSQFQFSGEQ